jgi:hypothetical protein
MSWAEAADDHEQAGRLLALVLNGLMSERTGRPP